MDIQLVLRRGLGGGTHGCSALLYLFKIVKNNLIKQATSPNLSKIINHKHVQQPFPFIRRPFSRRHVACTE